MEGGCSTVNVRLEVGTAHRDDVQGTNGLKIKRDYLREWFHPRRAGGRGPPLDERDYG